MPSMPMSRVHWAAPSGEWVGEVGAGTGAGVGGREELFMAMQGEKEEAGGGPAGKGRMEARFLAWEEPRQRRG